MVQKYVFQICQKLAIAAVLAVLCCLPAAAQTSQANETLILNNKPITFADLLKTYPDQAELRKVLMTIDRKTRNEFRDWEMAQLNKRSAEQDAEMARLNKHGAEMDAEIARLNKSSAEYDVALNQHEALKALINTLFDEQGVSRGGEARYRKQADIVTTILSNPLARPKNPETVAFLQNMEVSLKNGKNPFANMPASAKEALRSTIN